MSPPTLIPIVMKNIHTPAHPLTLHPVALENARTGQIVAIDLRARTVTLHLDAKTPPLTGTNLLATALIIPLPTAR